MEGDKGYKKGLWTEEEDRILMEYIRVHGKGRWNRIAKITGLNRCGKSCRLRWINYLSPSIKHGHFSEEEDDLIIRLHNLLGNRWSLIAGRVPGRTDNQVKNHWNTHLSKKLGIKKGKLKIARGSSRSLPMRTTETNESVVMDKSFEPPSYNNNVGFEYQNIVDNSFPGKVGIFEIEEPVVNESFESPFWSFNFDAPSLLEIYIEPIFS